MIFCVREQIRLVKIKSTPGTVPGVDVGKLVLSPTRTYAPIIKQVLRLNHEHIHGMIHCSGGGQTKILHFVQNMHIVKNNLFPVPPLFRMIQTESNTQWNEMYKVFNMGHRMELYVNPCIANDIIDIARSYNVEARIVGYVENAESKRLTINSEYGTFEYEQ